MSDHDTDLHFSIPSQLHLRGVATKLATSICSWCREPKICVQRLPRSSSRGRYLKPVAALPFLGCVLVCRVTRLSLENICAASPLLLLLGQLFKADCCPPFLDSIILFSYLFDACHVGWPPSDACLGRIRWFSPSVNWRAARIAHVAACIEFPRVFACRYCFAFHAAPWPP